MSHMTSATITMRSYYPYRATSAEQAILSHQFNDDRLQSFELLDEENTPGPNVMGISIYACGFDYVGSDEVVEWFKALPWRPSEWAILVFDKGDEVNDFYPASVHTVVVHRGKVVFDQPDEKPYETTRGLWGG